MASNVLLPYEVCGILDSVDPDATVASTVTSGWVLM